MVPSKLQSTVQCIGRIMSQMKAFLAESRAVSTVEYALITVAVVVVVGSGAAVMSGAMGAMFEGLSEEIAEQTEDARSGSEGGGSETTDTTDTTDDTDGG